MSFRALFTLLLLLCVSQAFAVPFRDIYADAAWSDLTGLSSSQHFTWGSRDGDFATFVSLKNEWFDTRGTDLPFQYSARGSRVGVGGRYWFAENKMHASASTSYVFAGFNEGKMDNRVAVVGYDQWEQGKRYSDLYGDLAWVDLADDVFLNVRLRKGTILARDEQKRIWVYGLGQVYASGSGDNGTENRLETGIGVGYIWRGQISANLDLRVGHSFQGDISDKDYFNPMLVISGGLY